ncbi:UTP--glucose-1-phosphate uridylyltransferase [Brevibacillus reuszeri]|uniref:UTP--glucose-1-phosphate uridylyltransferase GalU n=1 Tax=Brevibacillus reuszeri TaxID=54915 RepID=UPI001B2C80A1|nr:UTP--glucose-1-phosphate uridylyltransferase GalU [Brevibacillus reuszeri]GIO09081.1 UTP--glucose-1-phosphate uridylyltransferase [Brevibacillus reuszeri]
MKKRIKKAVIPAAGLGTRFLPATKAMPKEMLPIVDKPTIQYIVEEAVHSGIEDIIIVTGRSKRAIEDHFDKNYELEINLMERAKTELYEIVEGLTNLVEIHYIRQKEALGLGHAIWCARKFIGNEPFAVLLGDMVIDSEVPCLRQMMDIYQQEQTSVIAVEAMDWSEVDKYGVIDGITVGERLDLIHNLVEKPKTNAPSNLAIIGRYILEPRIFDILARTKPGVGGEIQLTDALQILAQEQELLAYRYEGTLYDVGSKLGFLRATIEFAMKNEELSREFGLYLAQMNNRYFVNDWKLPV